MNKAVAKMDSRKKNGRVTAAPSPTMKRMLLSKKILLFVEKLGLRIMLRLANLMYSMTFRYLVMQNLRMLKFSKT